MLQENAASMEEEVVATSELESADDTPITPEINGDETPENTNDVNENDDIETEAETETEPETENDDVNNDTPETSVESNVEPAETHEDPENPVVPEATVDEGTELNDSDNSNAEAEEEIVNGEPVSNEILRRRAINRRARNEGRRVDRETRLETSRNWREVQREADAPLGRKRLQHGQLIGVLPAGDKMPTLAQVLVEGTEFIALIPYSDFFDEDPLQRDTEMDSDIRRDRERRILMNSMGANVPFVITAAMSETDANDNNRTVQFIRASRKDGLVLAQRLNYFGRDENRNIRQYGTYNAEIVAVDRAGHTMWIELGGKEVRLFPGQITFRPLTKPEDLDTMGYYPGATIPVFINGLDKDEETRTVTDLRCSAALAEVGRWDRNLRNLSVNNNCIGVISRFRVNPQNGNINCIAWLDGFDAPVRVLSVPRFATNSISNGSRVALRVVRYNPEDSEHIRFYCVATRVYPATR